MENSSEPAVTQTLIGSCYLTLGTLDLFLYVMTLIALKRDKLLFAMPVFKLIFMFGVVDILAVFGNAIFTGLSIVTGSTGGRLINMVTTGGMLTAWFVSSTMDVVVAINRVVVIALPDYLWLFKGNKVYIWSVVAAVPGLLLNVVLYSLDLGMLFNPASRSFYYTTSIPPVIHTVFTNVCHIGSLLLTLLALSQLFCEGKNKSKKKLSSVERRALYQVIMFNSTQVLLDVIYFVVKGEWWELFAQLLAILVIGQTPLVLLTFNKTVRSVVLRYLRFTASQSNVVAPANNAIVVTTKRSTNGKHSSETKNNGDMVVNLA